MSIRKLLSGVAVAALTLAAATAAQAQTTLRVSSWAPPTHHVNDEIFPTWIEWLEQVTDGRVTAEIVYRLGPPPRQFDLIRDGVADVSWIFHGYNPGQFLATQAVELPLLGADAEAGSAAYWRTYENYMREAMDQEHEGVMIIGLMTHGTGVIQTKEEIDSWSDLEGMKIRVPGGIASEIGERLGVVKVSVPAPQAYEALQSGVADGIFMPVETHRSFRLHEVTSHILSIPGNFYDGSFAIIMNPETFNSLSEQDQQALMNVSGERLSAFAGTRWRAADQHGWEQARESNTEVSEASEEMMEEYRQIANELEQEWLNQVNERYDFNGQEALNYLREQARNYVAPASYDPE